jgi:hypothetical protein
MKVDKNQKDEGYSVEFADLKPNELVDVQAANQACLWIPEEQKYLFVGG